MLKLLKLGVYVAAGVGTYEILRRYGLLQKAGQWLNDQVPDDYRQQAQQYVDQVRDRAQPYVEQARQAVGQASDAVRAAAGQPETSDANYTGAPAAPQGSVTGPTITGAGRGVTTATDEPNGTHMAHTVGRGVVR